MTPNEATDEHYYKAVTLIVRDLLNQGRKDFMEQAEKRHKKQIYYLCMEFLMGRSLKNNLYNLGLEDSVASALSDMGIKIDTIYEQEPDAGLGNGGLGRLAACFWMAWLPKDIPPWGILCGMNTVFSVRRWWTAGRQSFRLLVPGGKFSGCRGTRKKAVNVLFNGEVEESGMAPPHREPEKPTKSSPCLMI